MMIDRQTSTRRTLGLAIAALAAAVAIPILAMVIFGPKTLYYAIVVPLVSAPPGQLGEFTMLGIVLDIGLVILLATLARRSLMRRRLQRATGPVRAE